jgi:hypothetical protein
MDKNITRQRLLQISRTELQSNAPHSMRQTKYCFAPTTKRLCKRTCDNEAPRIETLWHSESYREVNQDRIAIFERGEILIVAVADGVGGRVGGAEAAQSAVEQVRNAIAAVDETSVLSHISFWTRLLTEIDDNLSDDEAAGETTLVALAIAEDRITGAGVGDSGGWLISHQGAHILTEQQRTKPFPGSGAAFPVGFEARMENDILLLATDGLLK